MDAYTHDTHETHEQGELFTPAGGPTLNETTYDAASGRGYYVTAMDGGRVATVAGPYDTQREALDQVDVMSERAYHVDPKSWFYHWGTSLIATRRPGVLTPERRDV